MSAGRWYPKEAGEDDAKFANPCNSGRDQRNLALNGLNMALVSLQQKAIHENILAVA